MGALQTRKPGRILAVVALAIGLAVGAVPGLGTETAGAATTGDFVFQGGGYGHGVGMSQYGALGRALAGQGYRQILGAYYANTTVKSIGPSSNLRVHVSNSTSVQLTPVAPVRVLVDGAPVGTGNVSGPFTVNYTGSLISVVAPSIGCNPGACVGNSVRVPLTVGQPVGVSATQRRYHRGEITIIPAGSTMQVSVNGMSLRGYLYGVAEVPNSWPTAALRAQAIAARSFAEDRIRARRAGGSSYDLLSTTADQNYTGYDHETSASAQNWINAVNDTGNEMVTHNGNPINALYSSSNGGHSEDSGYVYITSLPYLRASPDPFDKTPDNPNHRWTRTYTAAELSAWLGGHSDTAVGNVKTIRIVSGVGASGRIDKADVRITGSTRTVTVSGARLRSVINGGTSSDLLSTKFTIAGGGRPDRAPFGAFGSATIVDGRVRLIGWAIDRDRPNKSLKVHVYVDGKHERTATARRRRADLDRNIGLGPNHGFDVRMSIPEGRRNVCVYAINGGPGTKNTSLGCKFVTVTDDPPFGTLDSASNRGGRVGVAGWAIDRDRPNKSLKIHVYVDGTHHLTTTADRFRPDVGQVHKLGADHGYRVDTKLLPLGTHEVCTYAINAGPGTANTRLGCKSVAVVDSQPFGTLDKAARSGSTITVRGWAIDRDRPSARLSVHVYVDGAHVASGRADRTRTDVDAVHGLGSKHGYEVASPPLQPGNHRVCTYALNAGPGSVPTRLGCANVAV